MSQCNYHSLKQIRADAKKKKMRVVVINSRFMGGVDVFVVPKKCPLCDGRGNLMDTNMQSNNFDEPYECYQCHGTGKGPSIDEIRQWKDCSDELPNGDVNHEKYFVAWFMQLTDYCVC